MSGHALSPQQDAICGWFEDQAAGHLVVRARAGTGKTYTIIEGIRRALEGRILYAAFNKRIQEEAAGKLSNPAAEAKTLHGVGYGIVRRYWEHVQVCERNDRAAGLAEAVCGGAAPDAIKRLVATLMTKGREIAPHARERGELVDLALAFDCTPDEEWAEAGFDLDYVEARALEAMALAADTKPATGIDYADMLFLPVRNHWLTKHWDLVVIDEAQDMTGTQLEMAQGVCRGRIAVVGDDRQAIYGFRGADSGSLDRLKATLEAQELGLTVTYRCGRVITEAAARLVPDIQAHPDAPEGSIGTMASLEALVMAAGAGDFILSRTNAPLAKVAMALIRSQKKVRIQGKDIGAGLRSLVKRLSTGKAAHGMPAFLERLAHWREREIDRAMKLGKDQAVEAIQDKAETIAVVADGVTGPKELEARLEALFSDNGNGQATVCSSVHKAKGLEADRVFILRPTLYPKRPKDKPVTPAQAQEESNIEYVAITRAKNVLTWVDAK